MVSSGDADANAAHPSRAGRALDDQTASSGAIVTVMSPNAVARASCSAVSGLTSRTRDGPVAPPASKVSPSCSTIVRISQPAADRVRVRVRAAERRDHVDAVAGFEHTGREPRTHDERPQASRDEEATGPPAPPIRVLVTASPSARSEPSVRPTASSIVRSAPGGANVDGMPSTRTDPSSITEPRSRIPVGDHDLDGVAGGRAQRLELGRVPADQGERGRARHHREQRHQLGAQRPSSDEHAGLLSGSGVRDATRRGRAAP